MSDGLRTGDDGACWDPAAVVLHTDLQLGELDDRKQFVAQVWPSTAYRIQNSNSGRGETGVRVGQQHDETGIRVKQTTE